MASFIIRHLISDLPQSLRDSVEGYVDAVSAALPEIQKEADVRIDPARTQEFLLVVAIRRIWAAVNNQYWTMQNCLGIAANAKPQAVSREDQPIRGFKFGQDEISEGSEPVRSSQRLRNDLERLLIQLEIRDLVTETRSVKDLAQKMFG